MSKETTDSIEMQEKASSKLFFRRKRACPFSEEGSPAIDYKDPEMLKKYISEGGRMLPSRITNISAKHQRKLKKAIKRSRHLALIPFVFKEK